MAPWLRAIIAVCSRLASEVEKDRPRCSTARICLHDQEALIAELVDVSRCARFVWDTQPLSG
jgi:hypothetical protein